MSSNISSLKEVKGRHVAGLATFVYEFETSGHTIDERESLVRKRNIVAKMGIQVEDIVKINRSKVDYA
ncbi:MAG: hypothetical protein WC506_02785 [Candidatus Micrarchaeia archaeon]